MTALFEIAGATVRFGGVTALEDVSLAVAEGELVGLIGPNGAGKTTLLRVATGIVRPQEGRVLLAGEDVTGRPIHGRVRRGLGLSQQLVRPFRSMTARDNVALAAGGAKTARPWRALLDWHRATERAAADDLLDRLGIAGSADALPTRLPLGVLKRLEMARALALRPKLLLLDEPLAGLTTGEAARLADTILALNQGGLTILLIEHNLAEVMRVARRLLVLDNGRLIANGPPAGVMADPRVRRAYLGEEADAAA